MVGTFSNASTSNYHHRPTTPIDQLPCSKGTLQLHVHRTSCSNFRRTPEELMHTFHNLCNRRACLRCHSLFARIRSFLFQLSLCLRLLKRYNLIRADIQLFPSAFQKLGGRVKISHRFIDQDPNPAKCAQSRNSRFLAVETFMDVPSHHGQDSQNTSYYFINRRINMNSPVDQYCRW